MHVGAPKTGTTYLQNVLWQNSKELASHGLKLPGQGMGSHHQAALRLRDASFSARGSGAGWSWHDLAADGDGWRGDVLVSSELLAWADEPDVVRAFDAWPHLEAHLVFTMRDLARQLPAVWQEEVKNRRTLPWSEFLARALAASSSEEGPGGMWGGQDPRQVLARWTRDIPPERVHVVTVPPLGQGQHLLWERFCQVLDVPPDDFDTDISGRNVGLGLAEAELLRRVNLGLPKSFEWRSYSRMVKHGVAESALAARGGEKVILPDEARPALAQRSQEIESYLVESGFDVVGDLADLHVDSSPQHPSRVPTEPTAEQLAEAGVLVIVELLGQLQNSRRRVVRLRRRLESRSLAGKIRATRSTTGRWARAAAPGFLRRVVRKLRSLR